MNGDYIMQSLTIQLSEYALKVAERDAKITEQHEQIKKLESDLEESRKQLIEEMDEESVSGD